MKKMLLKLMLTIMALAILVSACAPAPTAAPVAEVPATEAPAAEPTAIPEPTEIPVTDIELWAGGRVTEAGPPPEDWVAYQIIKDSAKVNLKLVLLPSTQADQDTKINAAAASNSLPDLFMVSRDVWYKLVQAGLIAKVDDLLPLMPVRTKGHYSDADRNKLVTLDGSMYGLPDPGALPQTDALVIRKDWLDKLGLEVPKTLDEVLTVAQSLHHSMTPMATARMIPTASVPTSKVPDWRMPVLAPASTGSTALMAWPVSGTCPAPMRLRLNVRNPKLHEGHPIHQDPER